MFQTPGRLHRTTGIFPIEQHSLLQFACPFGSITSSAKACRRHGLLVMQTWPNASCLLGLAGLAPHRNQLVMDWQGGKKPKTYIRAHTGPVYRYIYIHIHRAAKSFR